MAQTKGISNYYYDLVQHISTHLQFSYQHELAVCSSEKEIQPRGNNPSRMAHQVLSPLRLSHVIPKTEWDLN